jgi:hypothetical protein
MMDDDASIARGERIAPTVSAPAASAHAARYAAELPLHDEAAFS